MIDKRVFAFLRNFFLFLIDRLYKEWIYTCGKGQSYGKEVSERGDLYAKQLIENIIHDHARMSGPYMVDGNSKISYGKTSIILEPAHLTGISTLHRKNVCILKDERNRIFLKGTYGAGPLTYQGKIMFKFGKFSRKTSVLASLMDIKVSVDFSTEKETGRNGFLLNFAVNELNGFNLRVNGLGYFNWTINLILSFLTLVLGKIVRNLLEYELEQYIVHRLPKYQFPIEGYTHKNGTKYNIPSKDIQNNDESLYKSFYMKQNCKRPKPSGVLPIAKKTKYDVGKRFNSIEFRSNRETTKSYRSFLLTDNRTTEVDNFCLPEQNLGDCGESLSKNSCSKFSKNKYEENCNRFSELTKETKDITCSLNEIKGKLVSISNVENSSSQVITQQNRMKDACLLFNRNNPVELNDISEDESNSSESIVSAISSPPKSLGFEDLQNLSLLAYEKLENTEEHKMEDSSKMLSDFCEDIVSRAYEGISEQLVEISSKIHKLINERNVDEKAFNVGIKLPISLANYDSSSSSKTELSQSDVNIFEGRAKTFSVEGRAFLKMDPNQTLTMFKNQNSEEIIGRIQDSNKIKASVESCIHHQSHEIYSPASDFDLKFCNAEMVQNDFDNPFKDDEFEKDLKVHKDFRPEIETRIEDSESINYTEKKGVEMPEKKYISNPDNRVDKKHKLNEEIPFKYSKGQIGEYDQDTLYIADNWYTLERYRNSEMLSTSKFQNEDTVCSNLLEELECPLKENVSECTDCVVEFSSAPSTKHRLAETPDLKVLNDLQKEIIARTLKLKSNVAFKSELEDNEYLESSPVSRESRIRNRRIPRTITEKIFQQKRFVSALPSTRRSF